MAVETPKKHHHGNLRTALVDAGIEMLEAGSPFSLRAVARQVGVSQTAPYRHFPSKEHLEAAMAARGFRTLQTALERVIAREGKENTSLTDLALVYVRHAAAGPALYRLMYAHASGEGDERLPASAEVFGLIERVVTASHPEADAHGLATAAWALAHGLASLFLDGKLVGTDEENLDERVAAAFSAILATRTTTS